MNASDGIYVYAAVPARTEVNAVGIPDIRSIVVGDVGLVIGDADMAKLAAAGDADSDASSLAELAWKHDAVVRAVMSLASGVIPFRLGTVLRNDRAASEFATAHAAELDLLLNRLTASVEWGVQVSAGRKPAPVEHSRPPSSRPGTAFLASRRQELADAERACRERASVAAAAAEELRELAVDAVGGRSDGAVILDESYLIRQTDAGRFLDRAQQLGDRLAANGLLLKVTGPWPPYSFARLAESDE